MNQTIAFIGRRFQLHPFHLFKMPLWSHTIVCAIIASAGCVLLWHFMGFSDESNPDFVTFYNPVAQNIAAGRGITLNGAPALEYPPGYPVIIAGVIKASKFFGLSKEFANRLFVIICFVVCSLLIFLSACLFWNSTTATLLSCLWSSMPLVLFLNKTTSSEQPFMVFFYGCLLLFFTGLRRHRLRVRVPLFFIVGMACGIAMLIRPIAIGLGGILVILLSINRSLQVRTRIFLALSLLAGNAAAILPWEGFVFQETGRIIMLCKGRDSFSIYDGLTFAISDRPFRKTEKDVSVPGDVRLFMEKTLVQCSTASSMKDLVGFVMEYTRHHPLTIGKLFFIKAARSWYGTCSNNYEKQGLVMQMIFLAAVTIAAARTWRFYPEKRYMLLCSVALVFYFWALTVMVLSIARYMMPVTGFLVLLFPSLRRSKSMQSV